MSLNKNKKVAVTSRIVNADDYDEIRDAISHDWIKYLAGLNLTPVIVPNCFEDPCSYIKSLEISLIIFTGGDNISASGLRDKNERILLDWAIQERYPVLGVCRGMQLLNVFFGGRLTKLQKHVNCEHELHFSDTLARFYGISSRVNSFHELGIEKSGIGKNLIVQAVDNGGYIEAFRHCNLPVIGIMWHPERKATVPADERLIASLLDMV